MTLMIGLAVSLLPALAPTSEPVDLASLLEPVRAEHKIPGLVGVIVTRDAVDAIGACGVRKNETEVALLPGDRMHLGSCTKAMTATLCAILVEREKLAWETSVVASFPELGASVNEGWQAATLELLLTNRGGAPGDVPPALWSALFASKDSPRAQRDALAKGLLAEPPASPPGTHYTYSNAGFSLAGAMAERAAGRAYEDLIRELLFEPLGMKSAGFGPPGKADELDQPVGHKKSGKPVGTGAGADNPAAIAPAGRVHCSLEDWGRFVQLHLRDGELPNGKRLLSADTMRKLHTEAEGKERYAFGWGVTERKWGGRVLTHSGSNTMWYCTVWMAPEKGFAVLVATNQGGDAAVKACDKAASLMIADRGARELGEPRAKHLEGDR